MTRFLLALLCATLALGSKAQELKREKPRERSDFQAALGFELLPAGNMPGGGWRGGRPGTVVVDDKVVHGGRLAVRIERKPNVEVKPTIAGIREGRDEVLEEALRKILGSQVPSAIIEKMARP